MLVHPEYDVTTRTWFVPDLEFEAPTLAALARLLGPQVVVHDYYPLGLGPQVAATHIERAVRLLPPDVPPPVLRPRLENRRRARSSPSCSALRPPPHQRESRYDLNQILDMWSAGQTRAQIMTVVEGGISRSYLQLLVSRARAAGDPRAVRRSGSDSRERGLIATERRNLTLGTYP